FHVTGVQTCALPISLRHSLLASVLEIAADNSRFRQRIGLFELGKVYLMGEEGLLPDEVKRLAFVLMGPREPSFWQDGDDPPAYRSEERRVGKECRSR